MEEQQATTVIETALLCAEGSMTVAAIQKLFEPDLVEVQQIKSWLESIQIAWQDRGLELVETAAGWRFQSRTLMQRYLERLSPEQTPRYSRAVLETLAIIAWKQPVTRGDIEAIRGVTVSSQIIKTLEERGWVEAIGYRDGPGRPALLGTTKQFLDDLGLRALDELPPLVPIESEGSSGAELALGAVDLLATAADDASVSSAELHQQSDIELHRELVESLQGADAEQFDSDGVGSTQTTEEPAPVKSDVSETASDKKPDELTGQEEAMLEGVSQSAGEYSDDSPNEVGHNPTETFESDNEKEHNNRSTE